VICIAVLGDVEAGLGFLLIGYVHIMASKISEALPAVLKSVEICANTF